MKYSRIAFRLLTAAAAVVSFHLGFTYAQGAPVSVKDVIFTKTDGSTRMTVVTGGEPDVKVFMDSAANTLSIRLRSASVAQAARELSHSDDIVKSFSAATEKETGDAVLTIVFGKPAVFYKSPAPAGSGFVFDFRQSEKKLRIAGATPESLMGKRKTPAVETKETEKTLAAPEDFDRRFAEIDDRFGAMEVQSGREAYMEMMKKLQKLDFDQAVALADRFIAQYPRSIYVERVHFARADALYQKSKRDAAFIQTAMDAYNTATAMFPDSRLVAQAMARRADLYRMSEFYIEALSEYGGLLKTYPTGKYAVAAMLGRAQIYLDRGRYQQAYNELERILILYPARPEVRDVKYMVAESYYERDMYKEADIIFQESRKLWPTFPKTRPSVYMKIAETAYRLGNLKKAAQDWAAIANLFPEGSEGRMALLRIGDVYVEQGRKKDGAKIYESAARRFAGADEGIMARLKLASLGAEEPELLKSSMVFDYSALEDPLRTFDEIIAKHPEKHGQDALARKGRALAARKRYVSAILAYKQLLQAYPGAKMSGEVFNQVRDSLVKLIGAYHAQDGFFTVLLTYYDNFDPFLKSMEDPAVLYKIADSYRAMTLYDRAIEYYRLVNRHDSEGRFRELAAFNTAAAIAGKGGRPQDAERALGKFLDDFRGSGREQSARVMLGDALSAQGRKAEAATQWRLAVEMDPKSPAVSETAYKLGEIYRENGQYSLAVDSYNAAIGSFAPEAVAGGEPSYIKDSYYKLPEAYYLGRDYPGAIREAARFVSRYPEDERKDWMDYIISVSLGRIDREDMALPRLKSLAERGPETMIGKVAAARLDALEWKRKNPGLFPD